jgi:hypothetical protein
MSNSGAKRLMLNNCYPLKASNATDAVSLRSDLKIKES